MMGSANHPRSGAAKVRFLRASYFIWTLGPIAAYATYHAWGLPHVIWSYSFQGGKRGTESDFASRWYTRCTFVGPYGEFTTYPTNGSCPWLAFRKKSEATGELEADTGGAQ